MDGDTSHTSQAPRTATDAADASPRLVLQREPARSDVQVDVRRAGDHMIVTLAGRLSESFRGEELGRRLIGNVVFDTAEVDRITSFGVRAWLGMLDAMDADTVTFARCSEAVLNQMMMIRAFSGSGVIASFFAPYACESCGNGFRVAYDAIADADAITKAAPAEVPCPRCKAISTLDDDPVAFFKIGPLLTAPTEALETALGRLSPLGVDADPVEKTIRGDTTVVKFNTRMDASVRLGRIFDGLEGNVDLDLGRVPDATERGISGFIRALQAVDRDVTQVRLIGCPQAVAQAILNAQLPPRIQIRSVLVPARCSNPPGERTVFVDVARHAPLLAAGRAPQLRCDWCDDGLSVEAVMPLLTEVAARLSPAPLPTPVVTAAPPSSRLPIALLAGSAFLTTSAVLLGLVGMVFLAGVWLTLPGPPQGDWIAGQTPPPAWTENVWTTSTQGVQVVGGADGEDVESALPKARNVAMAEIVKQLRESLRGTPGYARTTGAIDDRAIEAYLREVSPEGIPKRQEVAVRSGGAQTRIFVRYGIDDSAWQKIQDHYKATVPFRGLELGPRFPTDPAEVGVPVVATASWLSSPQPGALLIAVGPTPVSGLGDAQLALETQWKAVAPGASLPLTFLGEDGERYLVNFKKKASE